MTTLCIEINESNLKNIAPILVGALGFITAILTLIYSNLNNKRNYNFLLEKDKRDREDRLKKDDLDFAKDKRERQKSYNRVLGSFLKVYHSYIQHKYLFNESGVQSIPDKYLIEMINKIDNLNSEIAFFKKTASEESSIIPELTIYLHEILNLLGRFEIVLEALPKDTSKEDSEIAKLIIQRAHSFAVEELLDEYFTELIEKISIKAEISDDFLKEIKELPLFDMFPSSASLWNSHVSS